LSHPCWAPRQSTLLRPSQISRRRCQRWRRSISAHSTLDRRKISVLPSPSRLRDPFSVAQWLRAARSLDTRAWQHRVPHVNGSKGIYSFHRFECPRPSQAQIQERQMWFWFIIRIMKLVCHYYPLYSHKSVILQVKILRNRRGSDINLVNKLTKKSNHGTLKNDNRAALVLPWIYGTSHLDCFFPHQGTLHSANDFAESYIVLPCQVRSSSGTWVMSTLLSACSFSYALSCSHRSSICLSEMHW